VKSTETWKHIHGERSEMADTLASLTSEQWASPSWCAGWSVKQTAGHILAASEQTVPNFSKELIGARLRFSAFTERGATRLGTLPADELVRRLRLRTTTTNHPPAPVLAMLGEIIVHGEDIRRPLGLEHRSPESALIAVANGWKGSNLLIGAKRRIAGLRLRATDTEWKHGDGPEVAGPLQSLIVAMTGRKAAYSDLSGDGLAQLSARP
jgi:uncharacterized protein (TIGR03083 family)